jgi:ribosomal protein S20
MMNGKQRILVLGIIIMGGLLIMACATPQGAQPVATPEQVQCIPEWTLNPPSAEDGVYGSGLAKLIMASQAKQAADHEARNEVAKVIEVKVQSMLKRFMQQSGIGDAGQALQFSQTVSKEITSQVLQGCKIVKRKVCPDGTWHSLALWPIGNANQLKNEINNQAKNQVKNEVALYNEFKAKNGFEDLQKELDKLDFTEKEKP